MSFCVNCGVELDRGLCICPLCDTPVINPREAGGEYVRAYPDIPVKGVKAGLPDLVLPVTLLLLIPASITLLSDYLTSGRVSWSIFVVSSLMLVWVFLIPPFAMRRFRLMTCLILDWVGLAAYLYVLSLATGTGGDWLVPIALPVAGALGVVVIVIAAVFKYVDLRKLTRLSIILFGSAAFLTFTEFITDLYTGTRGAFSWSAFASIPVVIIGIVALVVDRNKRLKQDLKERLFF